MAGLPSPLRRLNPVDIGAAAAVLLAAVGVIWSPKLQGTVARATGALRPVLVTVDVRGVPAADPDGLAQAMRTEGKTSLVIRNQPHGSVTIKAVEPVERRITVVLPNGTVSSVPDPNTRGFTSFEARLQLEGMGQRSAGGVVLGNQALKIGSPVELEGALYRINGTVSNVRLGGQ